MMTMIPRVGPLLAKYAAGPIAGISVDAMGCGEQDDRLVHIIDRVFKGETPDPEKTLYFISTAVNDMKGKSLSKKQQTKYMKLMLKNVGKQAVKDALPPALKKIVGGMEDLVGMEECDFSCDPKAAKIQKEEQYSKLLDIYVDRLVKVEIGYYGKVLFVAKFEDRARTVFMNSEHYSYKTHRSKTVPRPFQIPFQDRSKDRSKTVPRTFQDRSKTVLKTVPRPFQRPFQDRSNTVPRQFQ